MHLRQVASRVSIGPAITGQSQVIQSLLTEGCDINAKVVIRNALAH